MKKIPFQSARAVRETLTLPYEPVMQRLISARETAGLSEPGETVLSDKIAAEMCGVSERQIRKARAEGMNPYLADHLCVAGLGLHPMSVFGEDWLTAEAQYATELFDKKMTPDEVKETAAA